MAGFEDLIRNAIDTQNAGGDPASRERIYRSSRIALDRMLAASTSLEPATGEAQRARLEDAIKQIEADFVGGADVPAPSAAQAPTAPDAATEPVAVAPPQAPPSDPQLPPTEASVETPPVAEVPAAPPVEPVQAEPPVTPPIPEAPVEVSPARTDEPLPPVAPEVIAAASQSMPVAPEEAPAERLDPLVTPQMPVEPPPAPVEVSAATAAQTPPVSPPETPREVSPPPVAPPVEKPAPQPEVPAAPPGSPVEPPAPAAAPEPALETYPPNAPSAPPVAAPQSPPERQPVVTPSAPPVELPAAPPAPAPIATPATQSGTPPVTPPVVAPAAPAAPPSPPSAPVVTPQAPARAEPPAPQPVQAPVSVKTAPIVETSAPISQQTGPISQPDAAPQQFLAQRREPAFDGSAAAPAAATKNGGQAEAPETEVEPIPKKRPYIKMLAWVIILCGLGTAVWWAWTFGPELLKNQIEQTIANPQDPIIRGPFTPGDGEGWVSVFDPATDPSAIVTENRGTAELVQVEGGTIARLRSASAGADGNILIRIPPGVVQQMRGKATTFEIVVAAPTDGDQQVAIYCEFDVLGSCGRKRFEVGRDPTSHIFDVLAEDISMPADRSAYVAINTDILGQGRSVDVAVIRMRLGE